VLNTDEVYGTHTDPAHGWPWGRTRLISERDFPDPDVLTGRTLHQYLVLLAGIRREEADVGYCDEDGYLYLVDRKKDLIIVSGFNVYPGEVEAVLLRHPKVAQAAVIGAPHPYTGETVKAVVVLAEGEEASAEEIAAFCQRYLARFKCPEVIEFASAGSDSALDEVVGPRYRTSTPPPGVTREGGFR
jgi:hypothetical protein